MSMTPPPIDKNKFQFKSIQGLQDSLSARFTKDQVQFKVDSIINAMILALAEKVDISGADTAAYHTASEVDSIAALRVTTYNPSPLFQYMNMFPNLQTLAIPLFSVNLGTSSAYTLVDGRGVGVLVYIPNDTTLTGFKTYLTTQGVYVPDNYNGFKIYSVSGNTATEVTGGETTNDTADPNIWEATASTIVTKALPTPIAITKGLYLVCALWNTSDVSPTAPALGATASVPTSTTVFGNLKLVSYRSSQTVFTSPDDISTRTSIPQVVLIWLY